MDTAIDRRRAVPCDNFTAVLHCIQGQVRRRVLLMDIWICTWKNFITRTLYPLKPNGHYMYRPVVTICTASVTFNNSTFCPHSVFMCFVWIWEQTAIISLYSIDRLVFITETECVYCAVRSESSSTIPVFHVFSGFSLAARTQHIPYWCRHESEGLSEITR